MQRKLSHLCICHSPNKEPTSPCLISIQCLSPVRPHLPVPVEIYFTFHTVRDRAWLSHCESHFLYYYAVLIAACSTKDVCYFSTNIN